ncbi:uncharacterized protein LOC111639750 isoform X2 [Centruroides sculpturatus]|uniref:uncharacterized protein LOC111639750 isoform X2 n=1 Tax=Centruroides sculpturatus TaxID=218467 RepID=UPI000C6E8FF2|nr:uncharacterized protein LOC111639750 isoform X2 [Centruroides sculpturatus]
MSFFELIKGIEFSFNDFTGNVNKYTDTFLTRFKMRKRLLTNKDSCKLIFNKKYPIFDFIKVYDFNIYGLSSITRESPCNFSFSENYIKVEGRFSVRNVKLIAKFDFSSLIALSGHAEINLSKLDLKITLIVTEYSVEVESIQLLKIGRYEAIKIFGINQALAWAAKTFINASPNPILKAKIYEIIEHVTMDCLKSILTYLEIPIIVNVFVGFYKYRRQLLRHSMYIFPFLLIYFYTLLYFYICYIN